MRIHPAKISNYDSVKSQCLVDYINEYLTEINRIVSENELEDKDRTQLKAIAAELETVKKRLDYIAYGRY